MHKELWFSADEYSNRILKVQQALEKRGLDAFLGFQAESVTWLTGYYTKGYGAFQFVIVPKRGDPTIVCRDQSSFYFKLRSPFEHCISWTDSDNQIEVALSAIAETIANDAKFAIELDSWHLTAAKFLALRNGLPKAGFYDAENMVAELRLIKSVAEITYQRAAGKAAEIGMDTALQTATIGTSEREIAAEICSQMISSGSDDPGPGIISSGIRAQHLHGEYSNRSLKAGDILQVECTPSVRNYHARFMRTIKIGGANDQERRNAELLIDIQNRALDAVGPNLPASNADRIYRDGILASGLTNSYTNKTFYSIGLILRPSGGEPLEAVPGCKWHFEPNMTFHTYLLVDGFGFSETIVVTETGYERLTNYSRCLLVT
jgi:Xaa-Pro dipeptidase